MAECAWCKQEIRNKHIIPTLGVNTFHPDCWKYGLKLDLTFCGWLPNRMTMEEWKNGYEKGKIHGTFAYGGAYRLTPGADAA